jgi:hypothetical protein
MISRSFFAAVVAAGTAGSTLADVRVKTPGMDLRAPSGGVDLNLNINRELAPTQAWVGRAVYSIDGKRLGEVAAVADDSMYVDMGGFLGIGESRVLLHQSQIGSATSERIVVKMTEADAKSLPSTDSRANPPKR